MADRAYEKAREAVWQRERGACAVCGGGLHQVHHRQGRGGKHPHRLSNVIGLCSTCHTSAHANPSASYAYGRMVPRLGIRTPEDTPVLTRSGWVLYDNDGGTTATTPMKETA